MTRLADARTGAGLIATPEGIASFRAHAIEAYPHEALGYIDRAGAYHRLTNASDAPEASGLVPKAVMAHLFAEDRIGAFCHSHPGGPDCPSETDMATQEEMAVPFAICSTNGQATTEPFAWGDEIIDDADLLGRPFRHGVADCYALIRAWYRRERGVLLPDFARNWEWWRDETPGEKDLYSRHFADAGFIEVPMARAQPGDVWLAAMRSPVPNHAGIYLEGGLALHHAASRLPFDPMRLSKRDSVARLTPFVTHWLRRE